MINIIQIDHPGSTYINSYRSRYVITFSTFYIYLQRINPSFLMTGEEFSLAGVFRDATKHRQIAGIIGKYLLNRNDIREVALNEIELSDSKDILDLGCGFGFFTEALKDRVHQDARVTGIDRYPEYEWFYFQSCEKAGIKADFRSNGIDLIRKLNDNSFDLILCSYALYFFPEAIRDIARVLKDNGVLLASLMLYPIWRSLLHM